MVLKNFSEIEKDLRSGYRVVFENGETTIGTYDGTASGNVVLTKDYGMWHPAHIVQMGVVEIYAPPLFYRYALDFDKKRKLVV